MILDQITNNGGGKTSVSESMARTTSDDEHVVIVLRIATDECQAIKRFNDLAGPLINDSTC
ncbi:hypothetical protein D3C87_1940550 [compost metagenome]